MSLTTGGSADIYADDGLNPKLSAVVAPIPGARFELLPGLGHELKLRWSAGLHWAELQVDLHRRRFTLRHSGVDHLPSFGRAAVLGDVTPV